MGVGLIRNILLTCIFDLGYGGAAVDEAEFSIWMQNGADEQASDADLAFLAQNTADSWSANVSTSHWSPNVTLQSALARCFSTTGHTVAEQQKVPATPWTGSSSAPALPWETSLCISEYGYEPGTFASDARRQRGRYYLPPMSSSVLAAGDSGQLDGSTITAIMNEQFAFYQALGDGSGLPLIVEHVIFSRGAKLNGVLLPPNNYVVTYLSADATMDSQRRRRNKQTSGRINKVLTA